MEWKLTDEEKKPLGKKYIGSKLDNQVNAFHILLEDIAQAQAKKLVEWLDGYCLTDGHLRGRPISPRRRDCGSCLKELRRQVGL